VNEHNNPTKPLTGGGHKLGILASASNTCFNQLGCSISHGVATTSRTAASFMFVAKDGLFSIPLNNVNPIVGDDAGKTAGGQNYYSAIPEARLGSYAERDQRWIITVHRSACRMQFACALR
jgi:hypothetical protein